MVPAGFSHVFICDDGSDDNSTSILDLYKSRSYEYLHMIPAPVLKGGMPGQKACFAACKEATLAFTDWWFVAVHSMLWSKWYMVLLHRSRCYNSSVQCLELDDNFLVCQDSDEYLHSPSHGNVASYVATIPPKVSHLVVEPVRFGVRDLTIGRFKNELQSMNGTDKMRYSAADGSKAQLISQLQVHRGASNSFGEPEEILQVRHFASFVINYSNSSRFMIVMTTVLIEVLTLRPFFANPDTLRLGKT